MRMLYLYVMYNVCEFQKGAAGAGAGTKLTKVPSPPTRVQPTKFEWKVNDEMGYFELGKPCENDDLYVLNTTIVTCEHFHLVSHHVNQEIK